MAEAPAAYPPPVSASEFVMAPAAVDDAVIDVGVLIVGGGSAGLISAIRLAQLVADDPQVAEQLGEVPIALLDNGKNPGNHQLSGAIVAPQILREMFPDTSLEAMSSYGEVHKEGVYVMTPRHALRIPTPPPFRNHGNHIFSLSKLTRFLSEKAEELGVMILPETSATKLLVKDGVVRGVLTGDKGLDRAGKPLGNFEPGPEIRAKVTIVADGTAGHISTTAIEHFGLQGASPQVWSLGVKEVWKVAKPLERVIHTMGWPLRTAAKYREFGGSFIYPMGFDRLCIGMVVGLDYTDATFSVHDVLQRFKTHPFVRDLLKGGERETWGAKTIPEGGLFSMPSKLHVPGLLLVGDAAGMVNVPHLKGIHLAMRSGKLAAETAFDVLAGGEDPQAEGVLGDYDHRIRRSSIHKELHYARNMRQVFSKGFFLGGMLAGLMDATKGAVPGRPRPVHRDAAVVTSDLGASQRYPEPDGTLTFDKLSSVFASGNRSRDDQPSHLRVRHKVPRSVATTWISMCPAAVYELAEGVEARGSDDELVEIKINASNCVHCGAISAKGGRLTPAEGGSGPEYTDM